MDNPTWQPGMKLEEIEKLVILKALRFYGNNQSRTAQALGVSVRTIANKLKEYGVRPVDQEVDVETKDEAAPSVVAGSVDGEGQAKHHGGRVGGKRR